MSAPRNPKEVKQFLGLVEYYRKFVPRFADISRVLTLKEFLQKAPTLKYPDPNASYTRCTQMHQNAHALVC